MASSSDQLFGNGPDQPFGNGPLSEKEAFEAAIKDSAALAAAIKASAEQSPPPVKKSFKNVLDRPYTDDSFASMGRLVGYLKDLVSSQQAKIKKLEEEKAESDAETKAIIASLGDTVEGLNAKTAALEEENAALKEQNAVLKERETISDAKIASLEDTVKGLNAKLDDERKANQKLTKLMLPFLEEKFENDVCL